jgi:hypothetical protein
LRAPDEAHDGQVLGRRRWRVVRGQRAHNDGTRLFQPAGVAKDGNASEPWIQARRLLLEIAKLIDRGGKTRLYRIEVRGLDAIEELLERLGAVAFAGPTGDGGRQAGTPLLH